MDYSTLAGHPPDFEVRYRFYSAAEGGLKNAPPYQGYRCDWAYDGDEVAVTGLYMIWPEFLDENGLIIPKSERVGMSGAATMWILSHEMRVQIHRARIQEGIKGYFMEGSRAVAEAVVIQTIELHTNSDNQERDC